MAARVEIVTSGELIHSPYPERRKLNIKVTSNLRRPIKLLEEIAEELSYMVPTLPSLKTYAFSFCSHCDKERGVLCLRHRTVSEVPIDIESNLEYVYYFEVYTRDCRRIIKMHFGVGVGWVVDGAIAYDYCNGPTPISGAFKVVRPSGKVFTYKLRPGKVSSAWYIVNKIVNFLWRVVKASYISVEVAKE